MILLTEYFVSDNPDRQREYETCLKKNIENEYISEIVLLNSDKSEITIESDKIKMVHIDERPTYAQIFEMCNDNYNGEICIISNADIIFDDTLSNITEENIKGKFLALSRWDIRPDGMAELYDWSYSQDCWVYLSPNKFEDCNYKMGTLGCDNRIAYDANSSGLKTHNPAKLIRTYHLHNSNHRTYNQNQILMGKYMFVDTTDTMDKISENIVCNPQSLNQAVAYVRNKKQNLV
jgi:hypothetical protein